jgi:hypothetical protein
MRRMQMRMQMRMQRRKKALKRGEVDNERAKRAYCLSNERGKSEKVKDKRPDVM